jgi:hypothetical protein
MSSLWVHTSTLLQIFLFAMQFAIFKFLLCFSIHVVIPWCTWFNVHALVVHLFMYCFHATIDDDPLWLWGLLFLYFHHNYFSCNTICNLHLSQFVNSYSCPQHILSNHSLVIHISTHCFCATIDDDLQYLCPFMTFVFMLTQVFYNYWWLILFLCDFNYFSMFLYSQCNFYFLLTTSNEQVVHYFASFLFSPKKIWSLFF